MKMIDLNPHGGIGANCMYINIGPFHLVVDAGLNPKLQGKEALPHFDKIPVKRLDAIILTHCHLDHVGSLAVLSRMFPETPILVSTPTQLLAPRIMHNSISVMTLQRDELGITEYPLYTRAEVEKITTRFWETPFKRTRKLDRAGEELSITLYPSGHVAGAASVLLQYKHRKIFITGDISFNDQFTISGAHVPEGPIDTLVTETTRGTTQRQNAHDDEMERLIMAINDAIEGGGSALIPVFALGRMQELLMLMSHARKAGDLVQAPIFLSGLGVDLCDYFDELHRKTGLVHFSRKMISQLRPQSLPDYIDPHRGGLKKQGIYLVSSGMVMEKTPSYAVAASIFDDASSSILFVGYCDPETPGGEIQRLKHGQQYLFKSLDYQAELRARVERFDLSGHADREEIVKMAKDLKPRSIVLTHGDPEARAYFIDQLSTKDRKVLDPVPLREYEV